MSGRADAEAVARKFATIAGASSADTLRWCWPAHASTIDAIFAGTEPLTRLPARVAVVVAAALDESQRQSAGRGECRRSVVSALGLPTQPLVQSSNVVPEDPVELVDLIRRRRRIGFDVAVAAIAADRRLAPEVFDKLSRSDRDDLYVAAVDGVVDVRPVDLGFGVDLVGSRSGARRSSLRRVGRGFDSSVWDDACEDPRWWRFVEACLALDTAWVLPDIPVSIHLDLVNRVMPHSALHRCAAAALARSGASFELVRPLLVECGGLAWVALLASDPQCGAEITSFAAKRPGLQRNEDLLAAFAGILDDETFITVAVSEDKSSFTRPSNTHFLWDLAAGRGRRPVDGARFTRLCELLEQRHGDWFSAAVSGDTPCVFTRSYGVWIGPPDLGSAGLVTLWKARARRLGWQSLCPHLHVPSAQEALAELLAVAVAESGAVVDVGVLFEMLIGWPGTLEELVSVVGVVSSPSL